MYGSYSMKKAPKRELKLHCAKCMCVCVSFERGGGCVHVSATVCVTHTHACPSFAGFYRMNICRDVTGPPSSQDMSRTGPPMIFIQLRQPSQGFSRRCVNENRKKANGTIQGQSITHNGFSLRKRESSLTVHSISI